MSESDERPANDHGAFESLAPAVSPHASTEVRSDPTDRVAAGSASDCDGDFEEGPDLLLGRVLCGLYRIERCIGEGGMGTVYEATHVHLNKRFAVKVLSRKIANGAETVERFRHEAMTASNIEHDNIVDVVNFDRTEDGDVFIVMELLRGVNLAEVIGRGPVPLERAIPIAVQTCRALAAAHRSGIVHRDLKPENVFIVRKHARDFVKILDFGISKIKSAEAENVRVTRTGQLVGTPLYMSPEQARGESDVGFRADIYALGVLLYEMLTGTPPFAGSNYFQLLWKHGNEDPEPPSARSPAAGISPALEATILRMLAKDAEDRFASMEEVEAALLAEAPLHDTPSQLFSWTPSPPRSSSVSVDERATREEPEEHRRVRPLIAGLAALATVVVVVLLALQPSSGPAEEAPPNDSPRAVQPQPSRAAAPRAQSDSTPPEPREMVAIQFDSVPMGAEVRVGDETLGVTPLVAPLAARPEPLAVRFVLQGYQDSVISVIPIDGLRVHRQLQPERRRPPNRGRTPIGLKKEF